MSNLATLIPFKPGQSGNPGGKPVAARNRITAKFLYELADHFDENGRAAIQKVFEEKPDRYLAVANDRYPALQLVTTMSASCRSGSPVILNYCVIGCRKCETPIAEVQAPTAWRPATGIVLEQG